MIGLCIFHYGTNAKGGSASPRGVGTRTQTGLVEHSSRTEKRHKEGGETSHGWAETVGIVLASSKHEAPVRSFPISNSTLGCDFSPSRWFNRVIGWPQRPLPARLRRGETTLPLPSVWSRKNAYRYSTRDGSSGLFSPSNTDFFFVLFLVRTDQTGASKGLTIYLRFSRGFPRADETGES